MNVATALNDAYAPYTYVMLYSLFENNKREEICVYLLGKDLSEESLNTMHSLAEQYSNEIIYIHMDEDSFDKRLLQNHEWPMETCFRLQLNDVLKDDIDRLIYLDGDMIINGDITELYYMPFDDGKHLIVTHDMTMTPNSDETHGYLHTEVFRKMIWENEYFNAGMILMDFSYLREKYGFNDYISLAKELDFQIFAPDQDLLNYMHQKETQYVDALKYDLFACNAFVYGMDYKKVKESASIIHFVGEKPWTGGSHFHYDVENLWWDYSLKTVYREFFLDKFVSEVFSDSTFYQAIEKAEEMNRNLSGKNALGRPVFEKPKDHEKEQFIRRVVNDKETEKYVSDLYDENERLQTEVQNSLKQLEELMKSLQ